MARTIDIEVRGVTELVRELKGMPERLDKEMRKEFREVAMDVRDKARARARHPVQRDPSRPKSRGSYHWRQLVNSIVSGASGDSPTVSYGSGRVPGWAGWEFGGNLRYKQFPVRTPKQGRGNAGRFFFPSVMEEARGVDERVQKIAEEYIRRAFPEDH